MRMHFNTSLPPPLSALNFSVIITRRRAPFCRRERPRLAAGTARCRQGCAQPVGPYFQEKREGEGMRLLQKQLGRAKGQQGPSMPRELRPVLGWGSQDSSAPGMLHPGCGEQFPAVPRDTSLLLSPHHPVGVTLVTCQPCHIPTAWLLPLREMFHGLTGKCKRSFGCQVIKPGNYQCRAASSWLGRSSGDAT